ncbi:lytic murein transglycosylase [Saccharobesus litoralis]|uniref:Lytic murein transglycosylase n=1 Tax=Saccharobesus litoralis TaxID=2172099 RepID=A0A2S0VQI8_9ALTE|nr:lytic murein transglycosylase [Saccharobesus litoralis]
MIKQRLITLFLILGVAWSGPTLVAKELSLQEKRKLFAAAEYDASKGRTQSYRSALQKLGDYPLAPYVEMAYLKRYPSLKNKQRVREFLNLYTGTPLEWPVRSAWLKYLGKKGEAVTYLYDFRKTSSAELNCYKLRSELAIGGKVSVIAEQIADLWVVGESQPKACDPLFKQWQDAGYRSVEHIKKRIELAATGGKHTLLPYLIGLLPQQDQAWGQLWRKVRRDPGQVTRLSQFKRSNDYAPMIAYGLQRYIWRNEDKSIATWQLAQQRYAFTAEQALAVNKKFALALASQGDERGLDYFKHIPVNELDSQLRHWHLAILLKQQDWVAIASFVQSLPQEAMAELSNQYWLSRAQKQLGIKHTAVNRFKQIAKERHYYGFLAAAQVDQQTQINNYPYQAHYKQLEELSEAPGAKRAFEFLQLKRYTSARREWWHYKRTLSEDEKATAAIIAARWQWHDQALRTISQAGYLDDVDLRFPLAFESKFKHYAKQYKIPTSLAFAVARRESTFMTDAHSSAGARGLMQLMPATAKQVAGRKLSSRKLYDPSTNIKLGTKYLRQLLNKVDDELPLAIASYNAGYHRVRKWVPQGEEMDLDLWIETIPYKETREYVKSVLAYQQVYSQLLGDQQNLFTPIINKKMGVVK